MPAVATLAICGVLTVGLSVPPGAQWLLQAARDAADLARDQRALEAQTRDIRHDRWDVRRDWNDRDYNRSYYRDWR